MTIRTFKIERTPLVCRKPAVFRKACRLALGPAASKPGELNLIFTTNPEMRRINKRYLGHDYATDVVAFPYCDQPKMRGPVPFGDIFVSVDQARIQAKELRRSLLEELLTLAIHGTLHLVGYKDLRQADRRRMFARQRKLLGIALEGTPVIQT